MRTVVIIGGIILAGATAIAVMMSERNETAVPASQSQGITPANGNTAKLNPEHGMPEHRCDLAVGAPLTSASGTAVPVAAPQQPLQQTLPAPAGTKLNPAHGQPGHRCDLQVGAPLN